MSKPADAATSGFSAFLHDPLAQGAVAGLLTLIPVRNYPRWLRRSIIWGPIVIAGFGAAYLGGNPQMAQTLSDKVAETEQLRQPEIAERSEDPSESEPAGGLRGAALALIPGTALGAIMSDSMAAAMWADEKIDSGLRRIRLPFPRIIMGVAAGAVTWRSITKENQRDREKMRPIGPQAS